MRASADSPRTGKGVVLSNLVWVERSTGLGDGLRRSHPNFLIFPHPAKGLRSHREKGILIPFLTYKCEFLYYGLFSDKF